MKQCVSITLFILSCSLAIQGIAMGTSQAAPIVLEGPVHFLTPSGDPVLVAGGLYEVEATEGWLKLRPLAGTAMDAVLLQAADASHSRSSQRPRP